MQKMAAFTLSSCVFLFSIQGFSEAKSWKSGEILTSDVYRYGAFEARIKSSFGSGAISTFFLMKENSWVKGEEWQEIDFEIFGMRKGDMFQTQIMTPGDPRTENISMHTSTKPLSDEFQTYRIEWTPDSISFFFNGKLIRKETDPHIYAKFLDPKRVEDMRLRLGLWAGFSKWSGMLDPDSPPTPLWVDWVKVYSYQGGTDPFVLSWEDNFGQLPAPKGAGM